MKPTLRQLEYIVAVASYGTFHRAAEHCGVSQPGLSAQVQQLERGLGVRIFERNSRRILVTAAGERIVEQARRALRQVDDLVETAEAASDPLHGTIRLGVIPTIAPYLLPHVMPRIRKRFPQLRLLIREEQTSRLTAMVEAGELDLGLLALESELRGLESHSLFSDPFVLAVSSTHRLASRKRVGARDLKGEEVLLLEDGHCLREQTSVICDAAGACELGDFRATSLATLIQMVENGVGVTLLPEMAVRESQVSSRQLTTIPFNRPAPARTVALAWRPTSPFQERFGQLGEALTRYA